MRYPAVITKEGKFTLAQFPSCPGCQTQADPGEDIAEQAAEALEGWLSAHLITGDAPPLPPRRAPKGRVLWVEVPSLIAAKLAIRWARQGEGLTQAQLAKRASVSQQMIAKMEHPDYTPGIEVLERVMRALGIKIEFVMPAEAR
jgi:DNA-binding XRE family transcriptional regulator/predicted RNase H-like HicB family nuclease